ncbi:MAG TPA: hypothetical protein VEA99_03280 [Gemmatimonadaceae bacterium]|nr:hypothetical protein [Gemmatimonadaceae bacterium]
MRPPAFLLLLVLLMGTCATLQRKAAKRERELRLARIETMERQAAIAQATADSIARSRPTPRQHSPTPQVLTAERRLRLNMTRAECERVRPTIIVEREGPGGTAATVYRDVDCSKMRR